MAEKLKPAGYEHVAGPTPDTTHRLLWGKHRPEKTWRVFPRPPQSFERTVCHVRMTKHPLFFLSSSGHDPDSRHALLNFKSMGALVGT